MTEQNEGKDSLLALAILLYLAGHERTSVNPSRFRGLTQREATLIYITRQNCFLEYSQLRQMA